ncbi:MAG: hypothetical protein ACLUHL_01470 [Dysosmobacter welbionis]
MKMWGSPYRVGASENQDAYAGSRAGAFHAAVVCDGMGGTNGGQVASAIAVARFERSCETACGRYGHPAAAAGNAQRYRLRQ